MGDRHDGFRRDLRGCGFSLRHRRFSALDSIVNLIFLLALGILPSQPEENKYGPNTEANGVFLYQPKAPTPVNEVAITQ